MQHPYRQRKQLSERSCVLTPRMRRDAGTGRKLGVLHRSHSCKQGESGCAPAVRCRALHARDQMRPAEESICRSIRSRHAITHSA